VPVVSSDPLRGTDAMDKTKETFLDPMSLNPPGNCTSNVADSGESLRPPRVGAWEETLWLTWTN